nr:hypothetical protein CFP56_74036 [Quercus suber]
MILDELKLIDLNGCTSLEILPLRPEDGSSLCLLNCVKLINNEDYGDMLLTTLRHHIQFKGDDPFHYIIIPGREIPKWFRHQSVGTSGNLQVPSSDKLKGVVVCALFVLRQHHPPHSAYETNGGYIFTHWLSFYLKANGYESEPLSSFNFSEQFGPGLEVTKSATVPVASLLMRMIWKIQQKIPKLSESHDEYDRDENGTSGEADNLFPLNFL